MAYASWSVVFGEQPSAAKWNILGTNDSSFNDGTGIADSAILPKHLLTATGSSWAWASWTPTLTNITLGNGTLVAKYIQIGKTIFFQMNITLGSTSSVGTTPNITLPVAASSNHVTNSVNGSQLGSFMFTQNGAAVYMGTGRLQSSTVVTIAVFGATGTYVNHPSGITAAIPFAWASGDLIHWRGEYEAA